MRIKKLAGPATPPANNIKLTKLFTDHMVLQQEMNIPVWGKADPGGLVTVTFEDQEVSAVVNQTGEWKARTAQN